jgi:threonine-phosphate decarboxylase
MLKRCAQVTLRLHGGKPPEGVKYDFSIPVNPLGTPEILAKLFEEAVKLRVYAKYPDYEYNELRNAIAEFYGIEAENIIVLNGAAEGMNLAISCIKPEQLIVFEPTFGDYRYLAYTLKIPIVSISYREYVNRFELNLEAVEYLANYVKGDILILLSNPNNPTGAYVEPEIIKKVVELFKKSIVVVDEAFVELCEDCSTLLHLTKVYENLVVLRSLTKVFAVPGLRLGFLYTHNKKILEVLDACRQPWNVNSIATYVFSKAMVHEGSALRKFIEHSKHTIVVERDFLVKSFLELGIRAYKSHAPYILLMHRELTAREAIKALVSLGIYVRDASTFPYLTPYHVRIAIKLREENVRLIEAYRVSGIK